MSETVTASAIVYRGAGILIRGAPGAGKSSLAQMLIDDGGRLVGDDRIHLSARNGRVVASGHGAVAGLIELRGRGLVERPFEPSAIVRLVVECVAPDRIERLPEPDILTVMVLGVRLPRQPIAANSPVALMLVREALGDTGR
jgi:serine kinase of HPr protein (carbohydrate metabolism regulator)